MDGSPPLIAIDDAPAPAGGEAFWVQAADGVRLRAALFPAASDPRGSVVLSGGRTEPIEKYFEVIGELQARGFAVLAHDWRGQGLSARALPDRLLGHADGYDAYLSDFGLLLDRCAERLPRPWIALGHSMGGCLTLLAVAEGGASTFAGVVLSAPMLGVHFGRLPPAVVKAVMVLNLLAGRGGRAVGRAPNPADEPFEGNLLTGDRMRFQRYRAQLRAWPDLALGAPTWGWLAFAFKAMARIARPDVLSKVDARHVVIVQAGDDRVVDNAAQVRAHRNLAGSRLVTVEGARHEILMETDARRRVFWDAFDALAERVAPRRPSPSA